MENKKQGKLEERIAVLDDDSAYGKTVSGVLKSLRPGCEINTYPTWGSFYREVVYRNKCYSTLITDWNLELDNAYSTRLLADLFGCKPELKKMKVIVMSSSPEAEECAKAIGADFMQKTDDLKELRGKLSVLYFKGRRK